MLKKLGLFDTDLHSHNVMLANYEGKTGHSLGAVQLEGIDPWGWCCALNYAPKADSLAGR
ncbi:hypothetical protein A2U01_0065149 [Trifolium medium]|uniref:Uncharacterized protein n=1 Tax=Trifolium medium TaxID=97028 RepID=A0A392S7D8_9FABA|nr:hypothetical protein [Trifolium medium]